MKIRKLQYRHVVTRKWRDLCFLKNRADMHHAKWVVDHLSGDVRIVNITKEDLRKLKK